MFERWIGDAPGEGAAVGVGNAVGVADGAGEIVGNTAGPMFVEAVGAGIGFVSTPGAALFAGGVGDAEFVGDVDGPTAGACCVAGSAAEPPPLFPPPHALNTNAAATKIQAVSLNRIRTSLAGPKVLV